MLLATNIYNDLGVGIAVTDDCLVVRDEVGGGVGEGPTLEKESRL